MELYRCPALSKEAVAIWWSKLSKYEFNHVSKAFSKWTETNRRQPTPVDIIDLCKEQQSRQSFVALGRKFTPEEKAINKAKLNDIMKELGLRKSF
jgi:hypothetical protein